MRIFLVARGYPTPEAPQWGCFEKDQAEALVIAGHDVTIISYRQRPFLPYYAYWTTINNGVKVVSYSVCPGRLLGKFGGFWRTVLERWQLDMAYKKAVKMYGTPDVLYSHFLYVTNNALYLKNKYHIPLVGIEHWSEIFQSTVQNNVYKLAAETYKYLDRLVVVSSALKDRIKELFNVDSIVIHNMIGPEFGYGEKTDSSDKVKIISIGDLIPRKCFDLVINALSEVILVYPNFTLEIIGEGPEKEHLETLIREKNLTEKVSLVGRKGRDYIVPALQNADLYVLSSFSETFGLVACEALACGLPVIATDCGGPKDFIDIENGLIIPVNDTEQMANAILSMIKNRESYDRKAIAEKCYNKFSSAAILNRITEVLASCLP